LLHFRVLRTVQHDGVSCNIVENNKEKEKYWVANEVQYVG